MKRPARRAVEHGAGTLKRLAECVPDTAIQRDWIALHPGKRPSPNSVIIDREPLWNDMDLEAKPYRAFVRIAELGSFTRAAEELAISQPALSAQMRELERRLGFALFRRHNRRISLTAEGSIFLDRARRLIMESDWLNQAVRDIRENELRIGAAHHSSDIPERNDLIYGFLATYPALPMSTVGRAHVQLLNDLRNGDIDLALTLDTSGRETSTAADTSELAGLARHVLFSRPISLAIPADLERDMGTHDLGGLEVVTIGRAHGVGVAEAINRAILDRGGRLVRPTESDARSVLRYAAARRMAALDLGWFGCPMAGFVRAELPQCDLSTNIIILHKRGTLRAAAELFIDFAKSNCDIDGRYIVASHMS